MSRSPLRVALVGINAPGYRSLALDYLQAAVLADPRLDVALLRFDVDVTTDPWWTAYRLSTVSPTPDVVAFPVFCWTARHVYDAVRLLKTIMPGVMVILGGPEVGPIDEGVLFEHPEVDAIVRGEGELTFPELLHSLSRSGDFSTIPGLTSRSGSEIVRAPDREEIDDLDRLASPFAAGLGLSTDGSAYVETYRGCPHRCAYCFEGKGSTRIRSFSWDRIASDIEKVASLEGMQAFSFIDPVFNLTADRLNRLADLLEPYARSGVRLHTIEVDIERIDAGQAADLKRAGVVSVETGPQTIGQIALDTCHRSFSAEKFAAGVAACREVGIAVECDLIVGLPGDTLSSVMDGIDFAISLDPGRVQLSTLHVLPGTELWDRGAELGLSFDRQPPHEVVATRDLSYADLRRLEVFGNTAARVYQARLSIDSRSR